MPTGSASDDSAGEPARSRTALRVRAECVLGVTPRTEALRAAVGTVGTYPPEFPRTARRPGAGQHVPHGRRRAEGPGAAACPGGGVPVAHAVRRRVSAHST